MICDKISFQILIVDKRFAFLPPIHIPIIIFKYIAQTKRMTKQSNIMNIVLRREENGEIRLREDKNHMVDVELRNQIYECAKELSCTTMRGKEHAAHFCLLQQESIVDSWSISLVNIYKWDNSTTFGSKSITYKDTEVLHGT